VSWQHIKGHDLLVESFQRVFQRGRLAHAYLFIGPPGIGKKLFATELGKALLCERTPTWDVGSERLEACDVCPSCLLLDAATHPDFIVIQREAEKNEFTKNLIHEELQPRMKLKAARNKGKVAILDDVDAMNDEAANAFLKTLEEPPPNTLLILVGTSLDRQLPTIVSRCQVVRFAPLKDELVAELLHKEGVEDIEQAQRLAAMSDGSPGLAQGLSDPALWEFRQSLLDCLRTSPLPAVAFAARWTSFLEEAGKEAAVQRRRAVLCLHLLLGLLQDALRVSVGSKPRLTSELDREIQRRLAERLTPDQLLKVIERGMETNQQIERYVQLVLVIEGLMEALAQRLEPARR